ncbi:YfhO family protein [Nostoc sp. TCL26-01]|nr:YfhO family protein [Nostoc sp. TCL26-01]
MYNLMPESYRRIIHVISVILLYSVLYTLFFFPVIFSDKLLAPGDGIIQSIPAFYSYRTLWTDLLLSGFPVAADPQTQTWYPISVIFSLIPNSWNAWVISAYILASCFSYGYVYTITNSKLAAIVGGIIYGMSGFMMAHLGHTMMIHSAAWMPMIIWALEKLRHSFSIKWFASACFAIACCILAGHPQIAVYSIGMSGIYVFAHGWKTPISVWRYYQFYIAAILLGIALSCIQIFPTVELINLGLRSKLSFKDFNYCSLPLSESIRMLFPWIFGSNSPEHTIPYSGECIWGLTEVTGYVGILTLILAIIGFLAHRHSFTAVFWLYATFFTFLLTLGDVTPLANIMYHLPGYNKFRVPARHLIEMTLSLSVLAGYGVSAIQKQVFSYRWIRKAILISTGLMLASLLSSLVLFIYLQTQIANQQKIINFLPWSNLSLGIPILIFTVVTFTLFYWSRLPQSRTRQLLLVIILVIDIGSFGWFYEWQYSSPSKDLLTPTVLSQKYKKLISTSHQRILPIRGGLASMDEIPVNMSRLWGIPSASGYGPLILSRVSQLLQMGAAGDVSGTWASPSDRSLDIMSIKYVFTPKDLSPISNIKGINWSTENLTTSLGSGCNTQQSDSVQFPISSANSIPNANAIGIVSSLACSTGIVNNSKVLNVRVTDSNGRVVTKSLYAGQDTSEWAYDCSDVVSLMQHKRASIFESFTVEKDGLKKCDGHKYISILPIDEMDNIKSLEIDWVGTSGAINIHKISLINSKIQKSYPLTENLNFLNDHRHWHHIENVNQTSIYNNLLAMPRVWLVPEIISFKANEVLNIVKSSKLPDGRSYEPSKVAFVEENINLKTQNFDLGATTKFTKLNDTHNQVLTNSSSPAFLVLSNIYYPGWQAKIDGKPTHIFQTNYVLQGVLIPQGNHLIEFEFNPISFHIGAGISVSSLFLLGYILTKDSKNQSSKEN